MNNLSVLPFYEAIDQQNARRWWVYGHVFPLYAPNDEILHSQFRLSHTIGPNPDIEAYPLTQELVEAYGRYWPGAELSYPGWKPVPGEGSVVSFDIDLLKLECGENGADLFLQTVIPSSSGYGWAIVSVDGTMLINGRTGDYEPVDLSDYEMCSLYLQLTDYTPEDIDEAFAGPHSMFVFGGSSVGTQMPYMTELYTKEGKFVRSIWNRNLWHVETIGDWDYFIPTGKLEENIPEGQYYIRVGVGTVTMYSDVFTVLSPQNLVNLLHLAWWDKNDFVLDNGERIVYENVYFVNELYLPADIAKPEYRFDEEGETRDGHFFPTKQISQKVYKFHFLAPEYLLDVLRLVRMADNITIWGPKNGKIYKPETILFTPEWEAEGDIAAVTAEFETDTVAKKIGLAYVREA